MANATRDIVPSTLAVLIPSKTYKADKKANIDERVAGLHDFV